MASFLTIRADSGGRIKTGTSPEIKMMIVLTIRQAGKGLEQSSAETPEQLETEGAAVPVYPGASAWVRTTA